MRNWGTLTVSVVCAAIFACNPTSVAEKSGPELGCQRQAITIADAQTISFDEVADWAAEGGQYVVEASTAGQNGAVALPGAGYRRIQSVPIETLGEVETSVSLNVQVSELQQYYPSTVDLILRLSSAQIWWEHWARFPFRHRLRVRLRHSTFPCPSPSGRLWRGATATCRSWLL